jgi:hypothetical protein
VPASAIHETVQNDKVASGNCMMSRTVLWAILHIREVVRVPASLVQVTSVCQGIDTQKYCTKMVCVRLLLLLPC